jgi:autophagy-related protein 18
MTEPFDPSYRDDEGNISLVEMLYSTSLVALVFSPRSIRVYNTRRRTTICELSFPSKVIAVKMSRKRLAVVLTNQIFLYDISNMTPIHTIDTSPNPHGLCALSPSSANNFLIYPQPQKESPPMYNQPAHKPPSTNPLPPPSGEALVFDTERLEALNVIKAHQSTLGCLSINTDGTLLATASEKGTIIRVFSLPSGERLFNFRRGSLPAQIFCMSFNTASTLLAVSSSTETVHIFSLIHQTPSRDSAPASPTTPKSPSKPRRLSSGSRDRSASPADDESHDQESEYLDDDDATTPSKMEPENRSIMSMIRRTSQNVGLAIVQRAGDYLPPSVTEVFEPMRDFISVKVPRLKKSSSPNSGPVRSVVALSSNHPHLMVATSEGQFYVFAIDLEHGGEGVLLNRYSCV